MSILSRLVAWLGRSRPSPRSTPQPDCMSLQDWADLPAYHPNCR